MLYFPCASEVQDHGAGLSLIGDEESQSPRRRACEISHHHGPPARMKGDQKVKGTGGPTDGP